MKTALLILASICNAQSLFINAAGPLVPGDNTVVPPVPDFQADQSFSGGAVWLDPAMGAGIYSTLRFGPNFSYDIHISNGFYTVKFDLVEPNKIAANQRVFSITANGVQSDPLDVFALAPGINTPVSTSLLVMVGNGHLKLSFNGIIGNAIVSAIEITPSVIFSGIQQIWVRMYTCNPPLSDTNCTPTPAPPVAMQWLKCVATNNCAGVELIQVGLPTGVVALRLAIAPGPGWLFDPKQWGQVQ